MDLGMDTTTNLGCFDQQVLRTFSLIDTVIAGSETPGPEITQIHGVMTFVVPPSGTVRDGLSLW